MTVKDKAYELFEKFYALEDCYQHANYEGEGRVCTHLAKQCALIAVDEIINALNEKSPEYGMTTYWHPIDFYKEVKDEIEKL